jgi:hypothetical protein
MEKLLVAHVFDSTKDRHLPFSCVCRAGRDRGRTPPPPVAPTPPLFSTPAAAPWDCLLNTALRSLSKEIIMYISFQAFPNASRSKPAIIFFLYLFSDTQTAYFPCKNKKKNKNKNKKTEKSKQ